MAFKLSDQELAIYLSEVHTALTIGSRRLRGARDYYLGSCCEDAVQHVLAELTAHLRAGTPLPKIAGFDMEITAQPHLTRWAKRRLLTVFGTLKRKATRARGHARQVSPIIADISNYSTQHPVYDEKFLMDFLNAISVDPIAHRFSILMIASQFLPGTQDIDPCQNKAVAKILGCEPSDVRNARYRINTLKNRLLAERGEKNPEGSSQ